MPDQSLPYLAQPVRTNDVALVVWREDALPKATVLAPPLFTQPECCFMLISSFRKILSLAEKIYFGVLRLDAAFRLRP